MSLGSSQTAMGDNELPLMRIARWNSSLCSALATGEVIKKETSEAPDPCPIKVTASGSPPNAPMFSLIQCKAAIWSKSPKLLTTSRSKPGRRKPESGIGESFHRSSKKYLETSHQVHPGGSLEWPQPHLHRQPKQIRHKGFQNSIHKIRHGWRPLRISLGSVNHLLDLQNYRWCLDCWRTTWEER